MFRRLFATSTPASGSIAASLDLAAAVLDIDTDSCTSSIDEPRTLSTSAWKLPVGEFEPAILSTTPLPAAPTPPISRRADIMTVRYGNDVDDDSALFFHIDKMFDCTDVPSHPIDDRDFALGANLVDASNLDDRLAQDIFTNVDEYIDDVFHLGNHSPLSQTASPHDLPSHHIHSIDPAPILTASKSPFSSPMSSASLSAPTPKCTPKRKKRLRRRQSPAKDSAKRPPTATFLSPEEEDLPTPRYSRRSTRTERDPNLRPRRTLVGLICRRLSREVVRRRAVERSLLESPVLRSAQLPSALRTDRIGYGDDLDGPVSYAKDEFIDFVTGDSRHNRSSWFSGKNSRSVTRDTGGTRVIGGV